MSAQIPVPDVRMAGHTLATRRAEKVGPVRGEQDRVSFARSLKIAVALKATGIKDEPLALLPLGFPIDLINVVGQVCPQGMCAEAGFAPQVADGIVVWRMTVRAEGLKSLLSGAAMEVFPVGGNHRLHRVTGAAELSVSGLVNDHVG